MGQQHKQTAHEEQFRFVLNYAAFWVSITQCCQASCGTKWYYTKFGLTEYYKKIIWDVAGGES